MLFKFLTLHVDCIRKIQHILFTFCGGHCLHGGFYFNSLLICSIHGLIRGENMELGRDSDTGGQVLIVSP